MKTALLFPGQGSQYVGMGRSLWEHSHAVRDLFRTASAVLGFDLCTLCFEGPEERLNSTRYTQPAVFIVSVAAHRAACEASPLSAALVAGHSLGEYAALVAAGSLTFEDGLDLVRERAALMDEAAGRGAGGMVAVIGLPRTEVEQICCNIADTIGILVAANYNAPNQLVISGEERALETASEEARGKGAKTIRLSVSAPFHTPLMTAASERFSRVLDRTPMRCPDPPWVSNVTAQPVHTAEECRRLLAVQVCAPVRWEDSVRSMLSAGIEQFIELGPGKVLKGLCRRIDRTARCDSVDTLEDLEGLRARSAQ
ncbi:MAG: ACP S-malonyltransferase [bacterium]